MVIEKGKGRKLWSRAVIYKLTYLITVYMFAIPGFDTVTCTLHRPLLT
jgi:hypothetical protein